MLSLVSFLDDDLRRRAASLHGARLEAQQRTIPFILSRLAGLSVRRDVSVSSRIDGGRRFVSRLELP